jgi:hypothetical protein
MKNKSNLIHRQLGNARVFGLPLIVTCLAALPAVAQTFTADFTSFSGPACVKDKIGVYQTPFMGTAGLPSLTSMAPFLADAGVCDLRYEMGWGKPDTFAYDQISGTAASPTIDFSRLDPFVQMLQTNGIRPLFAVGYDPLPLENCSTWQCWKDVPNNLNSWGEILRQYAAHYSGVLRFKGIYYEIWNEPDLPGDGGKVFFNGNQTDYGNIYTSSISGVTTGAGDALIGGPAIAYDTTYVTQSGMLNQQMDFASIHAYANAAVQIAAMQNALGAKNAPIFITEYASYSTFSSTGPNSKYPAAAAFFDDVKLFLNYPTLEKVYWAQWVDDQLGMITYSLHKKAIYNAYKIYQTMLPVNRNAVIPDNSGGINTLAASGNGNAGIVVWNNNTSDASVTLNLNHLPAGGGSLQLYRIDSTHASYIDDPSSENLAVVSQWSYTGTTSSWTGTVPAQSVVFVQTAPPVAVAPTNLNATASYNRVGLTWNVSKGAISYFLKRSSTSGGPYAIIARLTDTNYTDQAVSSGATYYYVVAAINSLGSGADSAPVSATLPAASSALVAWFKADAITGVNSGATLPTWIDSSGGGYNATNSVTSHDPTYVTNAMNGKPVVRFNNANSTYLAFPRPVQDDLTIVCVFQSTQGLGSGNLFYEGAGLVNAEVPGVTNDFGTCLFANGAICAGTGNPDVAVNSSASYNDGRPHIFTLERVRSTGLVSLYVDGLLAGTTTGGTQSMTSPSRLVLGAQQTLANYLTGDLAEVKIYNVALADHDRQTQETQLQYKYAINNLTPPILSITFTGNDLVFTWPVSVTDFKLQSAGSLTPPVVWSAITNTRQTNNGVLTVTLPVTDLIPPFFRLQGN